MSTVYASRARAGRPRQLSPARPPVGDAPRPGFRPDIEGLRAVAVLLVVLSHAGITQLGGGYVGVDVFFVISGFLITTLLLKELTAGGTISIARATDADAVMINDTPRPEGNAVECVSSHLTDLTSCARDRDRAILHPQRRRLVAEAAAGEGAEVVDPLPWFCAERRCPAIVGNTLVYRDDSHITATYARLLAPMLDAALPS